MVSYTSASNRADRKDRTMQIRILSKFLLLALAVSVFPACSSKDQHSFRSTIDVPKTVTVYDTFRKTELWSRAIPVNHTLKLDFDREGDMPPFKVSLEPASTMKWELYANGVDKPVEEGVETMPGVPIIMKVQVRPAPEFPPLPTATSSPAPATPAPAPASDAPAPEPAATPEPAPAPAVEPETPAADAPEVMEETTPPPAEEAAPQVELEATESTEIPEPVIESK